MIKNAAIYAPFDFFPTADHLHQLLPDAEVTINSEANEAVCRWKSFQIKISRMRYDDLANHLAGFHEYARKYGANDGLLVRILSTLSVYGIVAQPFFDEDGTAMHLVSGLTAMTDALCLLDGEIYNGRGYPLLIDGNGLPTPDAHRVARRALVLLCVSFRALLEQDAGREEQRKAEDIRQQLCEWIKSVPGLSDEAEEEERSLLETPIGKAHDQAIIDGVWSAEGSQVLLWALGVRELPRHDQQEHPYDVARSVGVLSQAQPSILNNPGLVSTDRIAEMRSQLLAVHWRTTEYRLRPCMIDFREIAKTTRFGHSALAGVSLEDNDLNVGGKPIGKASPVLNEKVASIAFERHRAANWLIGAHPTYSQVGTPT